LRRKARKSRSDHERRVTAVAIYSSPIAFPAEINPGSSRESRSEPKRPIMSRHKIEIVIMVSALVRVGS